jgi:hypothetical protein
MRTIAVMLLGSASLTLAENLDEQIARLQTESSKRAAGRHLRTTAVAGPRSSSSARRRQRLLPKPPRLPQRPRLLLPLLRPLLNRLKRTLSGL